MCLGNKIVEIWKGCVSWHRPISVSTLKDTLLFALLILYVVMLLLSLPGKVELFVFRVPSVLACTTRNLVHHNVANETTKLRWFHQGVR